MTAFVAARGSPVASCAALTKSGRYPDRLLMLRRSASWLASVATLGSATPTVITATSTSGRSDVYSTSQAALARNGDRPLRGREAPASEATATCGRTRACVPLRPTRSDEQCCCGSRAFRSSLNVNTRRSRENVSTAPIKIRRLMSILSAHATSWRRAVAIEVWVIFSAARYGAATSKYSMRAGVQKPSSKQT